ncbi:MAG: D-2-hydroxyacid dehydrogenase [Alphaproteobacteria bacterium]|nr:D-2-hydroxyacid dehydrogenase [Alphaproteobacteria bacterium]
MTSISCCVVLSSEQQLRLRAGVGDWDVRFQDPAEVSDCPVIFGNPEPDVVTGNPALRWMQLESVGFGEYADLDLTRPNGMVQITNLASFFADPVAETALAGILALGRSIDRLAVLQQRAEWVGDPLREDLRLLKGANVLLFGYGAINRRVAELLGPFGCRIDHLASGWTDDALDTALADADILIAAAPDTPKTRGLFDQPLLARMKPGAVFCNFGRGSLVDEAALADALEAGQLGGAVIDVTEDEPLPVDHAFWRCPNTIVTQHSAGGTADELDRKIDVFLANLARHQNSEPLEGLVDFAKGY